MSLPLAKKVAYAAPAFVLVSETVRLTLRVLYALVPSLFNLLGLAIALFYPIHSKTHQEILAAIQKRRAGETVRDPLKPEKVLPGLKLVSSSRE